MKDALMPARHARVSPDEWPEVFVVDALQHLVENRLAIWRRNASDERELQLVSGEVFALGNTGITRV